jgi:pyruvate-ferredoxin/flavodoxin oxidoreductase
MKHFLEKVPKSETKIVVLDRSNDHGAPDEPLFMDIIFTIQQAELPLKFVGGGMVLHRKISLMRW